MIFGVLVLNLCFFFFCHLCLVSLHCSIFQTRWPHLVEILGFT